MILDEACEKVTRAGQAYYEHMKTNLNHPKSFEREYMGEIPEDVLAEAVASIEQENEFKSTRP